MLTPFSGQEPRHSRRGTGDVPGEDDQRVVFPGQFDLAPVHLRDLDRTPTHRRADHRRPLAPGFEIESQRGRVRVRPQVGGLERQIEPLLARDRQAPGDARVVRRHAEESRRDRAVGPVTPVRSGERAVQPDPRPLRGAAEHPAGQEPEPKRPSRVTRARPHHAGPDDVEDAQGTSS